MQNLQFIIHRSSFIVSEGREKPSPFARRIIRCFFSAFLNSNEFICFCADFFVKSLARQTDRPMPTTITQLEDTERRKTVLRVEGSMTRDDAELLEKIALDLRSQLDCSVAIDLADLFFLDSESAPILKRLEREHGFEIEGIEVFLQTVVSDTESKNS
jgi:translation initiation factor 1 (eIF-1/SUI1)